jgi:exodeoxyribonuclease VII large subunit
MQAVDVTGQRVVTVGELARLAKEVIEGGLPLMWIAGEVSNFVLANSGHSYFSLKDTQAQVRCVLFRHKLQLVDCHLENGMQVEVRASPSLYEPRGEFQLNVETVRRSGRGMLYEMFEKLKAKLQAERLFDRAFKRPLPSLPCTVGVVTSLQAAALRDVLTTLKRRMPRIAVIVYPTAVQGEGAARQIVRAITAASERAKVDRCEVLIVCRGGGSIEDLWAFNEEIVARAIRACYVPVISGIGHETDFTIADFVADARAPTPTAAAEMVSASRRELGRHLWHFRERVVRFGERMLERRMQQLDAFARGLVHPGERIAARHLHLGHLIRRLHNAWVHVIDARQWTLREKGASLIVACPDFAARMLEQQILTRRLSRAARSRSDVLGAKLKSLAAQLLQLSPQAVLDRGYSITETTAGRIVRNVTQVKPGEKLRLTFAQGRVNAKVISRG